MMAASPVAAMAATPAMPAPPGGGLPQAAARATTLDPAQRSKIAATAQQFEAMALTELLKPMFDTVDTAHGVFGGGEAEAAWQPMMVSELGKAMARHGGIGLARPVMAQMIRMQEAAR